MCQISFALFVFCLLLGGGILPPALAQSPTGALSQSESKELQQLLRETRTLAEEVRHLRQMLQKTATTQHETQILLTQITHQQEQVTRLTRELEQIRWQIQALSDSERDERELKELEQLFQETTDSNVRLQLQQAYSSLQRALERQKKLTLQELEKERERERKVEIELRLEQAKLTDLQDQLARLGRDLEQLVTSSHRTN